MDESVLLIGAIVSLVSALIAKDIYHSKNRSPWGGFALGLFLGVIGVLIALVVPAQQLEKEITVRDRVATGEMKVCPKCGNVVLAAVTICPKCGSDVGGVIPRLADLDALRKKEEQAYREWQAENRRKLVRYGVPILVIIIALLLLLSALR